MPNRHLLAPLLVGALLSACDPVPAEVATQPVEPSHRLRPNVARTTGALPERYAAALPASSAELQAWRDGDAKFPPEAHVAGALAMGDGEMFARLAAAAGRVSADDAAAWASGWHDRLVYREMRPAFCARARTVMAAPASTLRMALAGPFARWCAGTDARALVLRADTPDAAVLQWYSPYRLEAGGAPMPYDERLAKLMRDALVTGDRQQRGAVAMSMALIPDARAADALFEIHAGIADPKLADIVAEGMRWSKDARLLAIGAAACKRERPRDTYCDQGLDFDSAEGATVDRDAMATIAKRLVAAGFVRVDPAVPPDDEYFGADDYLVRARHAYWFDVETGTFPNEHDSLARELAALVSPSLDGVVFEEVAPDIDDENGMYLLRAYVDGQQIETKAQNLGDWYDVDAVLRLLDEVVAERNAPERFIPLDTEDQTLTIVAARPEVLRAAIADGLITSGDARTAEALGKDFEAVVRRKLESGEMRQR